MNTNTKDTPKENTITSQQLFNKLGAAMDSQDITAVDELMSLELSDESGEESSEDAPEDRSIPHNVTRSADKEDEEDAKAADEGQKVEASPAKEEEEHDVPSWVKKLDEEEKGAALQYLSSIDLLKKQNDFLSHQSRSSSGRVSALQKQINDLKKALEDAHAASTKQQASALSGDAPQSDKTQSASSFELEEDETLEDLKKSDPALYKLIKRREDAVKKAIEQHDTQFEKVFDQRMRETLQPLEQTRQKSELDAETSRLLERVPNAREVVTSPYWSSFVENSTPGVQALANSTKHEDVIEAMRLYSLWVYDQGLANPQAASQETVAAPLQETSSVKQTQQARREKLGQSKDVSTDKKPTISAGGSDADELDMEALLAKDFEKIVKQEGLFSRR